MKLKHGVHLAYCTNVHPGETWLQIFESLNRWTLAVKTQLGNPEPYAIGLRLSDQASRDLTDPKRLIEFQRWLEAHGCYIFTINGFPFGRFHGARVKDQVYAPDWTTAERLEYTKRLFDLLAQLVPAGLEGSVSTLPGSFKEFIHDSSQLHQIHENLWHCVEYIARLSEKSRHALHLGLEPEPLGLFENTLETLQFFEALRSQRPGDGLVERHLGVNYDTCHFAVEFEEPKQAIRQFREHGIRLSKIHLSNALKLRASAEALRTLADFADDVYLHQVIARSNNGALMRYKDLPLALKQPTSGADRTGEEWRVHFHVPLHCESPAGLQSTSDHVIGVIKELQSQPGLCSHLEMETYTWCVLPESLRSRDVSEQLVNEYKWTLAQLAPCGF